MAQPQNQQLTVLNTLPLFKGNARITDDDTFIPGVNVRVFFRALENYFEQNNILDSTVILDSIRTNT